MLSGTVAADIGDRFPSNEVLSFSDNRFSGAIPPSLSNLSALIKLGLAGNGFIGYVPPALGKLQGLTDLYLNDNRLEANDRQGWELITFLTNCSQLQHLVLGNNSFSGKLPTSIANLSTTLQTLYCMISYGAVYKCTLHEKGITAAVKVFNIRQSGSTRSFVAECEALQRVRHRSLIKIITCCSSIDPQGQEFKALVFEFMPNGNLKDWLHPASKIQSLSNTLSLAQRLDIAVDIMDALDYLHNQCQPLIIHCDLKPSNILLAEDMSARVGDFGISKILPDETSKTQLNSISFTGLRGSIGYLAPEYGEGRNVSTLGDVYSLGILLLEMFTGRSPTDDMFKDSFDLHKFAEAALPDRVLEVADPAIWLHEAKGKDPAMVRSRSETCLVSAIGVGVSCSMHQPRERMAIRDAASEMRAIRDAYLMVATSLDEKRNSPGVICETTI